MQRTLINVATLPLRVTIGAWAFVLRRGASIAIDLLEGAMPPAHESRAPAWPGGVTAAAAEAQVAEDFVEAEAAQDVAAEAFEAGAPPDVAAPAHVSEEPVLVADRADPGAAERPAGVEVHVAEPWEGYAEMKAADVIARIKQASAAEVGVIELYESAHRQRKTVIDAAARRLKELNPPGR
jgi:hypothetical protein